MIGIDKRCLNDNLIENLHLKDASPHTSLSISHSSTIHISSFVFFLFQNQNKSDMALKQKISSAREREHGFNKVT